jgi:hypothetical protein
MEPVFFPASGGDVFIVVVPAPSVLRPFDKLRWRAGHIKIP